MRIIVGVTGASGVEMSYYLVKALRSMENMKIFLVLSHGAKVTWELECSIPLERLNARLISKVSCKAAEKR